MTQITRTVLSATHDAKTGDHEVTSRVEYWDTDFGMTRRITSEIETKGFNDRTGDEWTIDGMGRYTRSHLVVEFGDDGEVFVRDEIVADFT